jgi:hypothetical protein
MQPICKAFQNVPPDGSAYHLRALRGSILPCYLAFPRAIPEQLSGSMVSSRPYGFPGTRLVISHPHLLEADELAHRENVLLR